MRSEPERWRTDYARDGYLVVEDCLDKETLTALRTAVGRIVDDPDSLPPHLRAHVQLEREYARPDGDEDRDVTRLGRAVRLVMELPVFEPVFAELIRYDPLLDVLQALFGSREFHFHNYKCVNKAPGASGAFVWHRDLPYLYHSTPNLLTAMLCLDDMTEENGATVVLPGSHLLADENVAVGDQDIREEDLPPDLERRTVTCPAGSAVIFHVNILHGGGANRSSSPRRNVIGIWAGPDTYPTGAARYAYQGLYPRSQDPARRRQLTMALGDGDAEVSRPRAAAGTG
ncbi:phytanoyl-CoA dioxygenase family protein [Actinopolymorpha sp. NPDC004070]|uniref:phytanoyl-CoA dioxygenase family protein n=1 Tax=Actinopolymorpha sp. NPDC004070 TaxID=3154548 RepID=UPI0033BB5139